MLKLHEFGHSCDFTATEQRQSLWAIQGTLIGIAFSLWRAVFLIKAYRSFADEVEHGERLLQAVIDTNAIGFPQDWATATWTSGYYLNNATLRFFSLSLDPVTRAHLSPTTITLLESSSPICSVVSNLWRLTGRSGEVAWQPSISCSRI